MRRRLFAALGAAFLLLGLGVFMSQTANAHEDSDCATNPASDEQCEGGEGRAAECFDGTDNDSDGFTDSADPSCPHAVEGPPGDATCSDGVDNDRDTLLDQADPDCQSPEGPAGEASCSDDVDNDGDGLLDQADPDCQSPEGPPEDANCSDHVDNDGDGSIDGADPDCVPPPASECSDGVDNDGDGATDFPFDRDCESAADFHESGSDEPECSDGVDNDDPEDTLADGADPACSGDDDDDETDDQPVTAAEKCTASEDAGLLTTDTTAETLWNGGLDSASPLTEDPEHNGVISGPLNDGFDGTPFEVAGDEASCALDLLVDEGVAPVDP